MWLLYLAAQIQNFPIITESPVGRTELEGKAGQERERMGEGSQGLGHRLPLWGSMAMRVWTRGAGWGRRRGSLTRLPGLSL